MIPSKSSEAVKRYKELRGTSLLDAKNFVEALTEELKAASPERFSTQSTVGCVSVLVFVLASFSAFSLIVSRPMRLRMGAKWSGVLPPCRGAIDDPSSPKAPNSEPLKRLRSPWRWRGDQTGCCQARWDRSTHLFRLDSSNHLCGDDDFAPSHVCLVGCGLAASPNHRFGPWLLCSHSFQAFRQSPRGSD